MPRKKKRIIADVQISDGTVRGVYKGGATLPNGVNVNGQRIVPQGVVFRATFPAKPVIRHNVKGRFAQATVRATEYDVTPGGERAYVVFCVLNTADSRRAFSRWCDFNSLKYTTSTGTKFSRQLFNESTGMPQWADLWVVDVHSNGRGEAKALFVHVQPGPSGVVPSAVSEKWYAGHVTTFQPDGEANSLEYRKIGAMLKYNKRKPLIKDTIQGNEYKALTYNPPARRESYGRLHRTGETGFWHHCINNSHSRPANNY